MAHHKLAMHVKTVLEWSPNKSQAYVWKLHITVCSRYWSGLGAMQTETKRSWPWQEV